MCEPHGEPFSHWPLYSGGAGDTGEHFFYSRFNLQQRLLRKKNERALMVVLLGNQLGRLVKTFGMPVSFKV
jgi:hypothetical protein